MTAFLIFAATALTSGAGAAIVASVNDAFNSWLGA